MSKDFFKVIEDTLIEDFGDKNGRIVYEMPIIQYILKKTKSANKGSKSRGSFANLYAIYILVEDYIQKGYNTINNFNTYKDYTGAQYSVLYTRQKGVTIWS